ncbi:hypothetical protein CEK26_008057 [Fusarium fujikuroi]|uniref:Uncharacterized protein n=1 Tax=Fusarium fujikuroi TaxID=5127 RepID=A0A5Q3ERH3_FUSFU|nr:hypothetical protein CEK27_008076 [Fusarium fujikuroi]QGI81372.1 hypothetical protein CEK25_008101 [Fusarium fujikuroi]QGI94988.1 hypothetical protein CEK26_008057 [Fusarium fujikuroi]VTT65981.1 unnamed protein product [Fusarium fujikuroi]VTT79955.1 unnamed protein product [Fusarium fujikuroi]
MATNEAGGISHYPLAPGWSPSPCLGAIVKVEQPPPPPPANYTATPLMMTEEDQSEIIYYLGDSEIQLMISRLHQCTVLQASAVVVSWLKMSVPALTVIVPFSRRLPGIKPPQRNLQFPFHL